MSQAIAITRRDLTVAELRAAASRTKDARAARRMLAIALVLGGVDRRRAAESCGMDRQTLRDWVHRYNAEGLPGLANRRGPARPRRLSPVQTAELAAWVEAGPDPARDGGGALAAQGSPAADRGGARGGDARAHGGQVSGGAGLPPTVGAPAPPQGGPGGPGGV